MFISFVTILNTKAREYAINTWLSPLMEESHTFLTHYFDFTLEEAKALKNSFNNPTEDEKKICIQVRYSFSYF